MWEVYWGMLLEMRKEEVPVERRWDGQRSNIGQKETLNCDALWTESSANFMGTSQDRQPSELSQVGVRGPSSHHHIYLSWDAGFSRKGCGLLLKPSPKGAKSWWLSAGSAPSCRVLGPYSQTAVSTRDQELRGDLRKRKITFLSGLKRKSVAFS